MVYVDLFVYLTLQTIIQLFKKCFILMRLNDYAIYVIMSYLAGLFHQDGSICNVVRIVLMMGILGFISILCIEIVSLIRLFMPSICLTII